MSGFLIRNLDDTVMEKLRERARRNGHSIEDEAFMILRAALYRPDSQESGLDRQIASATTRDMKN